MSEISLGVGLTSACTYSCRHCYSGGGRNPVEIDHNLLLRFLRKCNVSSINLGTGESCLHPLFHEILEDLFRMGLPVALTTAGPSLEALSDCEVSNLHDVDFSLDFPDRCDHDSWRASGAFDKVIRGIGRCRNLGVTSSVAMCLMDQNAWAIEQMCSLCGDLGVSLRVNVYKALRGKKYQPSYESFWNAVEILFGNARSVACSEPVVNAALMARHGVGSHVYGGSPCGKSSLRIRPGGLILPCVYWNDSSSTMEEYLSGNKKLPESCELPLPHICNECPWLKACMGGCSGRRLYSGTREPDIYCFMKDSRSIPSIPLRPAIQGDLYIHASYLCTMIAEMG